VPLVEAWHRKGVSGALRDITGELGRVDVLFVDSRGVEVDASLQRHRLGVEPTAGDGNRARQSALQRWISGDRRQIDVAEATLGYLIDRHILKGADVAGQHGVAPWNVDAPIEGKQPAPKPDVGRRGADFLLVDGG